MDDRFRQKFEELFRIEIDGWAYGIANYPGEVYGELVHGIIKELGSSFTLAIEAGVEFNIPELAERFSKASKYLVPEKEIAFNILAHLPHPADLGDAEMETLAGVIDTAEKAFPGAMKRLQTRWAKREGGSESEAAEIKDRIMLWARQREFKYNTWAKKAAQSGMF